ncbi:MAG: outer membrane protein transport protein, partial [Gammaproteobacteria bacterium]|nr:outer membrane protein transport protein [Gammaproteobacteria bacterium]
MNQNRYLGRWKGLAIFCASALLPMQIQAAGFQLLEHSVSGLGRSFSGTAALAEDASTVFFNPAGMSKLETSEIVAGISIIDLSTDFDRELSIDAVGQPLSGGEGGDIGDAEAVPNFFYTRPINDKFSVGIGVTVPFGLTTEYEEDSIFRYQAILSEVRIININPSFSYKFNDIFSIGFGINYQRMDVELSNAVDFGAVCFGNADPTTCTSLGLLPQSADGLAVVEGDSSEFGFNFGLLVENANTRFGFSYRDSIEHNLSGDGTFTNVPQLFTAQGLFLNGDIRA